MLSRKIAYIDLTKGTIAKEDIPLEWRQKYLGARGINNFLLYSLADPSIDPLGPENPLILGVGLLTGLPDSALAALTFALFPPSPAMLAIQTSGVILERS